MAKTGVVFVLNFFFILSFDLPCSSGKPEMNEHASFSDGMNLFLANE